MNSEIRLGYKLYILALLFASLAFFFQVVPINTSDYFEANLGISQSQVVNLTSLYFISYAALQIPGGIFFDKFGLKMVLPISIAITTLGTLLYFSSLTPFMLGFSRFITGIGCAVGYISAIYIAIKFLPAKWLSLLIGVLESFTGCGSVIAAQPFKVLINHYGFHVSAYIVIGFCLFLLLSSLVLVRNIKSEQKTETTIVESFKSAFKLFKKKRLICVFIYSFTTWLVIMSFAGYWLKNYLIHVHEYSEVQALDLIQVYWASFMIASLLVSIMIKDIASAKIFVCLLAGLGLITYFLMAIPIIFSYHGVLIVVICGGISASGVIVAFSLVPKLAPPELSGSVVAMNNTFIVLGGFVGQVIFGYVLENFDIANVFVNYNFGNLETHYYTALLIYPLFTLIAFIAILYVVFGKLVDEII
jgi:MFS family permease